MSLIGPLRLIHERKLYVPEIHRLDMSVKVCHEWLEFQGNKHTSLAQQVGFLTNQLEQEIVQRIGFNDPFALHVIVRGKP
jgi:hypothetical protein